jgi:DNA-binding response OmpR family regulator
MATEHDRLNILIVEDNDDLRESLVDALARHGDHIRGVESAEAVPEQSDLAQLDLAILDLNLPGEDGLSLAARLRATHPTLGIIMLTARTHTEDRASGYAQGADIYIPKPASLHELEQAIHSLIRRIKPPRQSTTEPSITLVINQRTIRLSDGKKLALTHTEVTLLTAFVRAAQFTLETWQIAELIGQESACINKHAIELHIGRLRKKLAGISPEHSTIQAVRGRGYQLCITLRLE